MKSITQLFILLLLTLSVASCGRMNNRGHSANVETTYQEYVIECFCKGGRISCVDIDRIMIAYAQKGILTQFGLTRCDEVLEFGRARDTTLVDRNFICRFINLVNRLEILDNNNACCDFRVVIMIISKYEKPRTILCLGENWGILLEGQEMKHCQDLFDFIDDTLYPGYREFREAARNGKPTQELWELFERAFWANDPEMRKFIESDGAAPLPRFTTRITDFTEWNYLREIDESRLTNEQINE